MIRLEHVHTNADMREVARRLAERRVEQGAEGVTVENVAEGELVPETCAP